MAIGEYYVVSPESSGGRPINRTWNGAAAGAQISDLNIKKADVFVVEAESTAEAIKGVRQLYGGRVAQKIFAILKSSTTEE